METRNTEKKTGFSVPEGYFESLPGRLKDQIFAFFSDLCHIQAARAVGEAARICTELFYGYDVEGRNDADFIKVKAEAEKRAAGSGHAKDRAGAALTQVMIPEALDYPL